MLLLHRQQRISGLDRLPAGAYRISQRLDRVHERVSSANIAKRSRFGMHGAQRFGHWLVHRCPNPGLGEGAIQAEIDL